MNHYVVANLLNHCNTDREKLAIRFALALIDNRPEDAAGLAQCFVDSDPIPDNLKI